MQPADDVLMGGVHSDLNGHLLVGQLDASLLHLLGTQTTQLIVDGLLALGHKVVISAMVISCGRLVSSFSTTSLTLPAHT